MVDELAQALAEAQRLIAAVRPKQWDDPSACTDWTVRQLVNHLVVGDRLFASVLLERPGQTGRPRIPDSDQLGADPAAAHRESAAALLAAFGRPGVLEQVFSVPAGTVPGSVALHLRITETLVHGWDLARATGQSAQFPDDLAERELSFAVASLGDIPAGRRPFASPQPVDERAPTLDRLAARLGRTVGT